MDKKTADDTTIEIDEEVYKKFDNVEDLFKE